MSVFRLRRASLGFTLIEVLAVTGIMGKLAAEAGNFRYAIDAANQIKGIANLKQIHLLIQVQAITARLPNAAFYPQGDPKTDPKSIIKLLPGALPELFVSPFAPDALKQKGLTFAWNDSVNGKDLDALPRDTWLLVDLAAFIANPDIPKPTSYLILYADGRAVATDTLPPDIVKAVKEAEAKAKEQGK